MTPLKQHVALYVNLFMQSARLLAIKCQCFMSQCQVFIKLTTLRQDFFTTEQELTQNNKIASCLKTWMNAHSSPGAGFVLFISCSLCD